MRQRRLYVAGEASVDGERLQSGDAAEVELAPQRLAVLPPEGRAIVQAGAGPARVVLIGGAPLGRRLMWWNFVATRPELIEQAAEAWERDELGQVAGETERIPLPAARWRRP